MKIVISLTSYPARIKTVSLTVRSLLAQTVKPWKIVLWLARDEFPEGEQSLPPELTALTVDSNFEIDWCENLSSYKKLIPALRKYPDCAIVTTDDDIFYPPDALARLLESFDKHPGCIQSMWVRVVTARKGQIQPFLDWLPSWHSERSSAAPSFDNYLLGGSPSLYPPHCLDERVFDEKTAMELCPRQDDIWFWAMAVLKGTRICGVSSQGYNLQFLPGTAETALWNENRANGGNDKAVARILEVFPEVGKRLSLDHEPLPKPRKLLGKVVRANREGGRTFSVRMNIPFFQIKYNDDFSVLTYYFLRVPVWRHRCKR